MWQERDVSADVGDDGRVALQEQEVDVGQGEHVGEGEPRGSAARDDDAELAFIAVVRHLMGIVGLIRVHFGPPSHSSFFLSFLFFDVSLLEMDGEQRAACM